MKQTEQEQQDNGDLVLLIWQIEKLRRREGGCTMNELISEAKKNFEGIEQIKIKKIMKQTAVEWLYERLERIIPRTALYDIDKREYFQQAKEIEKQQIIDAYIRGNYKSNRDMYWKIESAEKHYNETFNK